MPRIELIQENLHDALSPYHHEFDNLPLRSILARQTLINTTLDKFVADVSNAMGSAGSLAARLDKSLTDSGGLKAVEIDAALHSIEEHEDSNDYVRMTADERAKLALIDDEANELNFNFETASPSSTPIEFETGTVVVADSTSITWRYESGKIKADLSFATSSLHQHTYNEPAIHVSNYRTFKTPQPFVEGSLRVYVNGTRVYEGVEVYHPGATPTDPYTLNQYVSTYSTGVFIFDSALESDDIVMCDFDRSI